MKKFAVSGVVGLVVLAGLAWLLRGRLMPLVGVNVDTGSGGRARLELPAGFGASVFAEGLSTPRFMAVSPEGVLFVAERGTDRVVALPDRDGDGQADDLVEVGRDYGNAHDIEFADDGSLLVAGESTLYRVTVDPGLWSSGTVLWSSMACLPAASTARGRWWSLTVATCCSRLVRPVTSA